MPKHRVKRKDDGGYEYRGCPIRRVGEARSGYWGRWVILGRYRGSFGTLRESKEHIDLEIEQEAIRDAQ